MKVLGTFLALLLFWEAYAGERFYGNILLMPSHIYGIIVSKSHQKSVVIRVENGQPVVVEEFVSITGLKFGDKKEKGDLKTPEGVYFPVSFKSGRVLPSYYGAGAFPLNYPNALDRYILKRNGDGIWIHGYSKDDLLFFSSKGCVILKDKEFLELSRYIALKKTPVVIQERYSLLSPLEFKKKREKALSFLNRWKEALTKLYKGDDSYIYLLYSRNFRSSVGERYDQINRYKKQLYLLGENEPFVKLLNKTLLYDRRENGQEYFIARFSMVFLSGDRVRTEEKVLYIKAEENDLKIISEETL